MAERAKKSVSTMQVKHISHKHIDSLSDGVFSIALTLLGLDVLALGHDIAKSADLNGELLSHWPVFFAYALGFIVLYSMWYSYHVTSQYVLNTSAFIVWQHGIIMAFVALVPFATTLLAESLNTPNMMWGVFYFGIAVFGGEWSNGLFSLAIRGRYPTQFADDFPVEVADKNRLLNIYMAFNSVIGIVLVGLTFINPWLALAGYVARILSNANPVGSFNGLFAALAPRFFRLKPASPVRSKRG